MNNEQKTPERFLTEETENFFGSGIETLDSIEGTLSTVEKLNETEILEVISKIIEYKTINLRGCEPLLNLLFYKMFIFF